MSVEMKMLLASVACLAVGTAGYLVLSRDHQFFLLFAHLGAIGAIGLLGTAAGSLAKRKHRSYPMAFFLGFAIPLALGGVAVIAIADMTCGGAVSLLVAIVVIAGYFLMPRAVPSQPGGTS